MVTPSLSGEHKDYVKEHIIGTVKQFQKAIFDLKRVEKACLQKISETLRDYVSPHPNSFEELTVRHIIAYGIINGLIDKGKMPISDFRASEFYRFFAQPGEPSETEELLNAPAFVINNDGKCVLNNAAFGQCITIIKTIATNTIKAWDALPDSPAKRANISLCNRAKENNYGGYVAISALLEYANAIAHVSEDISKVCDTLDSFSDRDGKIKNEIYISQRILSVVPSIAEVKNLIGGLPDFISAALQDTKFTAADNARPCSQNI